MERGYLKLWRKSLDSEVFASESLWKLWSWCLMKTTHKIRHSPFSTGKGNIIVTTNPGQFIFGRNKAAEVLGWSPSTVWKRMQKLEEIGCVKILSNNQYSIVSICNWGDYQCSDDKQVTSKEQASDKQVTTKELPSDTDKNVKNVKNGKKKEIYTDGQKDVASDLIRIVSLKRELNVTASQELAWVNNIRLMETKDGIPVEKMVQVLDWYEKNWMNQYVPVIESACAFREKWAKLLNAIDRDKKTAIKDKNNGFDQRDYQKDATQESDIPEFLR